MKKFLLVSVLAFFILAGQPIHAQTALTGTWRVESTPPFEVFLRSDGTKLTGIISYCSSLRPVAIYEGTLVGRTISFKCRNFPENERTVTFTGTVNNDEIAFAWTSQVREGGTPFVATSAFAPSAPSRFTAKRVPDAELAKLIDQSVGTEFAAAVNLAQKDIKVEGILFVPEKLRQIRAVIVVTNYGLGPSFYRDPEVRKLLDTTESGLLLASFTSMGPSAGPSATMFNLDGVDGLIVLLQRLAQESGRPELADAPLVFWGHSAAGGFGAKFLAQYPQRIIAFVLYHSAGGGGDPPRSWSQIPTLVFKGGRDTVGTNSVEDFWRRGRSANAPWTFAVEPDATHDNPNDLKLADDLAIPWLTAVLRLRLPASGSTLRPVTDGASLLGNIHTAEVSPYQTFSGSKTEASWLPDEQTSRGWQTVLNNKPDAGFTPVGRDPQNPIFGVWKGLIHEESSGRDTYRVELQLQSLAIGQVAGRISYPGLDCSVGSLIFREKTTDAAYVFSGGGCGNGRIVLRLLPDDRIFFESRSETASSAAALAILDRKILGN